MSGFYDYLIVGSGLAGATFAHLARRDGKRCLVIDKRPHLGGNVYCEEVEGIHVHKYGAHIFHTDHKETWDFVNGFVPFNRFTNSPLACYQGKLYNLPFNMNTFYQMWGVTTPAEAMEKVEEQRTEALAAMQATGVTEPRNLEEQALLLVGRDIYERLIAGFTWKQWGRPASALPASLIRRLPVRFVFDNNYFDDAYQGIPQGGYNALTEGLLEGVECRTGVDFLDNRSDWMSMADKVVYTGAIDAYYDYRFGSLEWRTARFEQETLDTPNYQGNAVVNFTGSEVPYTRSIEHKHFESYGSVVYDNPRTVVSREYSEEWVPGKEPFFPINDDRNNRLYASYQALSAQEENVIFCGRLAEYKYYDMAPVMERAMQVYINQ